MDEFRAALKRAVDVSPRELTKAVKAVGTPLAKEAASYAPHRTGELAGGYKASVRGAGRRVVGAIVSNVPYAGGAEWGVHEKWSGFTRYGGRGERFAGKAVFGHSEQLTMAIYDALKTVVTAFGWFSGG